MAFTQKFYVVDSIMGSGKTEAIIDYINRPENDCRHFMVIVPYLSEVERYKKECKYHHMVDPIFKTKTGKITTKFERIKELIMGRADIVSTHSLFLRFDQEIMELIKEGEYTLILDETVNVINPYDFSSGDFDFLIKHEFISIDYDTGIVRWNDKGSDYDGWHYAELKSLCDCNSLAYDIKTKSLFWMYPSDIFKAFCKVFVLTYHFEGQLMSYYFELNNVKYNMLGVKKSYSGYELTEYAENKSSIDYKKLIHICDNEKMNEVGKDYFALSSSWYDKKGNAAHIKRIKNNLHNFFQNICKAKSSQCMWTTFDKSREKVKGMGYMNGFLPVNSRATNEYIECTAVAYTVNRYMNPFIKSFFLNHKISVDEDQFALSEMLQFIWRSAIRDGKGINLYIPSSRMRGLLEDWIAENSVQDFEQDENK